jgi:hypothetical protein
MKKILLCLSMAVCVSTVFADEFPIDLNVVTPLCGKYKITESSTRKEVMKFCQVNDTHSGMVRLFRGTQKLDVISDNMGNITCKFNRSLVNTDGALKECWSTTPPANESASVTIKSKASQ